MSPLFPHAAPHGVTLTLCLVALVGAFDAPPFRPGSNLGAPLSATHFLLVGWLRMVVWLPKLYTTEAFVSLQEVSERNSQSSAVTAARGPNRRAYRQRPRRTVWLLWWKVAHYLTLTFRLVSVADHHGHASLHLWRSAGPRPVLLCTFPSAAAAVQPSSFSDLLLFTNGLYRSVSCVGKLGIGPREPAAPGGEGVNSVLSPLGGVRPVAKGKRD
ncbi:hypothetical protein H4582DRAFT_2054150 [Lactarius indigo]|nr:hypothetical protein H4582DRAFT_2054150 [Lactarius indigo]